MINPAEVYADRSPIELVDVFALARLLPDRCVSIGTIDGEPTIEITGGPVEYVSEGPSKYSLWGCPGAALISGEFVDSKTGPQIIDLSINDLNPSKIVELVRSFEKDNCW